MVFKHISHRLRFLSLPLAAVLVAALSGCSVPKVQAWDKQDLAKPEMALDADRLETRHSEHIYFSREGSSGGWSIGGGGCGCN